jgi:hypothetical protein
VLLLPYYRAKDFNGQILQVLVSVVQREGRDNLQSVQETQSHKCVNTEEYKRG